MEDVEFIQMRRNEGPCDDAVTRPSAIRGAVAKLARLARDHAGLARGARRAGR